MHEIAAHPAQIIHALNLHAHRAVRQILELPNPIKTATGLGQILPTVPFR